MENCFDDLFYLSSIKRRNCSLIQLFFNANISLFCHGCHLTRNIPYDGTEISLNYIHLDRLGFEGA